MRFIIWDEKDGRPSRNDAGEIDTPGLIGVVGPDNTYLTTYGARPDGVKRYYDLQIGECVRNVRFSLSGSVGYYSVYRVR